MLIYIYQNYSAILYPPFFPTLSPVPSVTRYHGNDAEESQTACVR